MLMFIHASSHAFQDYFASIVLYYDCFPLDLSFSYFLIALFVFNLHHLTHASKDQPRKCKYILPSLLSETIVAKGQHLVANISSSAMRCRVEDLSESLIAL